MTGPRDDLDAYGFTRDNRCGECGTALGQIHPIWCRTEQRSQRSAEESFRRDRISATRELRASSTLKPCPFDGGSRLTVIRTERYENHADNDPDAFAYQVHCTSCAADGPWRKSQSGAEQYWNGLPGTIRQDSTPGTDRSKLLIAGLVGDRQHLYLTSPEFHAAIDSLAAMVALWIDGIAAKAIEQESVRRAELDRLMKP